MQWKSSMTGTGCVGFEQNHFTFLSGEKCSWRRAAGSNKIDCQAVLEEQKFSVPVSLSVVMWAEFILNLTSKRKLFYTKEAGLLQRVCRLRGKKLRQFGAAYVQLVLLFHLPSKSRARFSVLNCNATPLGEPSAWFQILALRIPNSFCSGWSNFQSLRSQAKIFFYIGFGWS